MVVVLQLSQLILADIFGTKYVGGIHGRLLTAWSTAGVLGPLAITQLRQGSMDSAIQDLVSKISRKVSRDLWYFCRAVVFISSTKDSNYFKFNASYAGGHN